MNSPSREGPSFVFEKFTSQSAPMFSKFDRVFQEIKPLEGSNFENCIPIPHRLLTPNQFTSPPMSPPQNNMTQPPPRPPFILEVWLAIQMLCHKM